MPRACARRQQYGLSEVLSNGGQNVAYFDDLWLGFCDSVHQHVLRSCCFGPNRKAVQRGVNIGGWGRILAACAGTLTEVGVLSTVLMGRIERNTASKKESVCHGHRPTYKAHLTTGGTHAESSDTKTNGSDKV